jgi:hypothetical protein
MPSPLTNVSPYQLDDLLSRDTPSDSDHFDAWAAGVP